MKKSQRHSLVVLQGSLFAFGISWMLTVLDESVWSSTGWALIHTECSLFFPVSGDTCVYLNHPGTFTFISQLCTNKPGQFDGRGWLDSADQLWGCVTWWAAETWKISVLQAIKQEREPSCSILKQNKFSVQHQCRLGDTWMVVPICRLSPHVTSSGPRCLLGEHWGAMGLTLKAPHLRASPVWHWGASCPEEEEEEDWSH